MKHFVRLFILVGVVVLFSSCATIFSRSTYPVIFDSTPSEAKLEITNKKGHLVFLGSTPTIVPLKSSDGFFSKAEYQVKISMPGYQDFVTTISSSISGWYFGNILIGGFIGLLIIDPASGAMWKLDREYVNVGLTPVSQQALQILSIDQVPDELKDQLVRIN